MGGRSEGRLEDLKGDLREGRSEGLMEVLMGGRSEVLKVSWLVLMVEEEVLLLYELLALLGMEILPQSVAEESKIVVILALAQRPVVLPVHLPKALIEVNRKLEFRVTHLQKMGVSQPYSAPTAEFLARLLRH